MFAGYAIHPRVPIHMSNRMLRLSPVWLRVQKSIIAGRQHPRETIELATPAQHLREAVDVLNGRHAAPAGQSRHPGIASRAPIPSTASGGSSAGMSS